MLVLLPNNRNSLKLEWTGPYKIRRRMGAVDYEVEMVGRKKEIRVYHINLLKKWNPPSHVYMHRKRSRRIRRKRMRKVETYSFMDRR